MSFTKHENTCFENQCMFLPFAFDTFGFLQRRLWIFLTRVQWSCMVLFRPISPKDSFLEWSVLLFKEDCSIVYCSFNYHFIVIAMILMRDCNLVVKKIITKRMLSFFFKKRWCYMKQLQFIVVAKCLYHDGYCWILWMLSLSLILLDLTFSRMVCELFQCFDIGRTYLQWRNQNFFYWGS